jgi:hypothetical protein
MVLAPQMTMSGQTHPIVAYHQQLVVGQRADKARTIAARFRQIGIARVLYGSDTMNGTFAPKTMSAAFTNCR